MAVASQYPQSFTEDNIDERSAYLADLITEIWPGPEQAHDIVKTAPRLPPHVNPSSPESATEFHPARSSPQVDTSATHPSSEAIRELLRKGFDTSETSNRLGGGRNLWLDVLDEEARFTGEVLDRAPTPADAVALRDVRNLRWEKVAARLYGDSRRVGAAKRLYDQAKGEGAAKRSFTGRGRLFPDMEY